MSPGAHAACQRAGRIRIKTQEPTTAWATVNKDRQGSGLPLPQGVCVCVSVCVHACVCVVPQQTVHWKVSPGVTLVQGPEVTGRAGLFPQGAGNAVLLPELGQLGGKAPRAGGSQGSH